MHIVLGLLGTIVTILILLHRLKDSGFDPNSLNPFLWYRRHKWRQTYGAKPIYSLKQPLEAAALLLVATAKCEGDMSAEQKQTILAMFEQDFHLTESDASGLMGSSVFLLKDETDISNDVANILLPSREDFSDEQIESTLTLMKRVAEIDGPARKPQTELIAAVESVLAKQPEDEAKQW